MNKTVIFKKFEVIGKSKDEALESANLNIRVDASQAYKKWAETHTENEEEVKEWMKQYLDKKKFNKPGDAAYIVLQSAVTDSRERPYKEEKPKYETRNHTFERFYVLRSRETGAELGVKKTSKEAKELAKELVADMQETVDIFVEAKVKEKNSLYTSIVYTPSKGTRPFKAVVFGYCQVD